MLLTHLSRPPLFFQHAQVDRRDLDRNLLAQRSPAGPHRTRRGRNNVTNARFAFLVVCLAIGSLGMAQEPDSAVPADDNSQSQSASGSDTSAGQSQIDEPAFSGPQADESLPNIPVWVMQPDDQPSKKEDLAAWSRRTPIAIAFMHEKSRPAFGLARLMSEFTAKYEGKMQCAVVVLTDDRSKSEQWLGQIRRYFKPSTRLGVAEGGVEGPGSLGLNRLVAMTVLIADDGKVLSNFALTQVSTANDGPQVLKAMSEAIGGVEVPPVQELLGNRGKR